MRNIFFVSLLLIVALASCSPQTVLTPTVINSAPPTKTLPTSTHISTPKPSATIAPTASETPSPTATIWAFNSQVSPNGEFIANAYFEHQLPSGIETIEIRNKEGKLIWQIPFQGEMPSGDPHRLLNIFQWANDSSNLYFYYVLSPDGGDNAFWWTGLDLQKFDIKTGAIQPVLHGEGFMSFSISPDGTKIAYTKQHDQPSVIYIRDLSTGVQKTAYVLNRSINYFIVGDIRWSPTGNRIAFQTQDSNYTVQTIYLNLLTMKQRVIQEYKVYSFDFQGWADDGKLEFKEFGKTDVQIIQIDVSNDKLVVVGTPTPSP